MVNVLDGNEWAVDQTGVGTWDSVSATASPDGRHVAISGQLAPAGPERPPGMPITEWLRISASEPSRDPARRLVVVDLATGRTSIIPETFENFAFGIAWTADGESVAFGIPFEPATTVAEVRLETATLTRYRLDRYASLPVLDLAE
jgi:hypothetical protein